MLKIMGKKKLQFYADFFFCYSKPVHVYGPGREKTCLRGLRSGVIQRSLLSYTDYLDL